ncbi:MAG: hypothetical protein AAB131_10235 [Actinomycetota bacterium]
MNTDDFRAFLKRELDSAVQAEIDARRSLNFLARATARQRVAVLENLIDVFEAFVELRKPL